MGSEKLAQTQLVEPKSVSTNGHQPHSAAVKPKRKVPKKTKRKARAQGVRGANRAYPTLSFEEALAVGLTMQEIGAGQKVRRLTFFEKIGKSPDSSTSRQMVTASAKYGITKGSYAAEWLEFTADGMTATAPDVSPAERLQVRFKLAILNIPPFKLLYEHLKGNKLPSQAVLRDFMVEQGFNAEQVSECIETFVVNAKFLGLLRPVAGAERLLTIEHVSDESPSQATTTTTARRSSGSGTPVAAGTTDWSKICFYITPIGEEDSDHRRHSDLFLNHLIEPAMQEFGLQVVRADHIGKPGMISAQVIEHVVRSRLVIADLSYHNPNVFYELSVRHVCGLPTVQLIRAEDPIPFDLDQFRTVRIDTASIYTLVPQLETYRAEIANQARRVLSDADIENPLTTFFPGLKVTVPALSGT